MSGSETGQETSSPEKRDGQVIRIHILRAMELCVITRLLRGRQGPGGPRRPEGAKRARERKRGQEGREVQAAQESQEGQDQGKKQLSGSFKGDTWKRKPDSNSIEAGRGNKGMQMWDDDRAAKTKLETWDRYEGRSESRWLHRWDK